MPEPPSIDRRIELDPAYDYAFLRVEGLAHIQRLSKLVWTDHNLHDPGITTLEILCYALTDLAYRTGFDTQDLMTRPDGKMDLPKDSGLAPAHEVLTTGPRTVADYRRLLLRIEDVRNAWLDPMQEPSRENYRSSEVPLFADRLADGLTYSDTNAAGQVNPRVQLSGLYQVQVELEVDDQLGSLNESALVHQVRSGKLKGVVLAFDCADPAFLGGTVDLGRDLVRIDSASVSSVDSGFAVKLVLTLSGGRTVTLDPCSIRVVEARPRPDRDPLAITAQLLRPVVLGSEAEDMVPLFWRKQQRRARALEAVMCALHAHRGLCEDFLAISTVAPYHVGICADINVAPDADLEEVQAHVFNEIEKYLSPPIRCRALEELLSEGRRPDEIFDGPFVDFELKCGGHPLFTRPGFVTDEDLERSELRHTVLASDIIDRVVDLEGVEAISNVQLRAYGPDGRVIGTDEPWTLAVPAGRQPVFYVEGSKLLFHKAGFPYLAQVTELRRTLEHLRGLERRRAYVPMDQVLPECVGRWRNLDTFYSVQNDFPATYEIGDAGISKTDTRKRIAQARQLKGYLTFFDQVLADYLGQLANLRRLYSLDAKLTRTWFAKVLKNIPGTLKDFDDEFFLDDVPKSPEKLARLSESEEEFLERRNRLLDHLIARFAERFSDYVLLSFRLSGDRLKTSAQLIEDKIEFLAAYPKLSRGRGQAANLRPEDPADVWNVENVSGLERRVSKLLGIHSSGRDLHCGGHFDKLFATQKTGETFRVAIRDAKNRLLFSSSETFADAPTALGSASRVYPRLRDEGGIEITETPGGNTYTLRIVSGPTPLTHKSTFATETEAAAAGRAILDRYDEVLTLSLCQSEGMHLIEHILLRPVAEADPLMRVCLPDAEGFCGDADPYSFRVSVVLPYWPARFRDMHFRSLLERTLREEAPAHVQVRVCWIGQRQMTELDAAYHAWLKARAAAKPDAAALRKATSKLIEVLEQLTTIYPAASLHDCDVGEDENAVRLGSTALGIF